MNVNVMIKDCETMRGGSVHVVMRHAIVEVQCVNVVIGVHIVVLVVQLVVVRVVPIFLVVACDHCSSRRTYGTTCGAWSEDTG